MFYNFINYIKNTIIKIFKLFLNCLIKVFLKYTEYYY